MERQSETRFATIGRRDLLGAIVLAALAPGRLSGATPAANLKAMLDRAAAFKDPSRAAEMLRGDALVGLSRADAAIHRMVLRGMEREAALQRAFPFGKADGSSPYAVSHRHGAWLEAGGKSDPATLAMRLDGESERLRADDAAGVTPPRFLIDRLIEGERQKLAGAAPEVQAALGRQVAVLERLRASTPAGDGVWRLRQGPEYFALRLRCTSGSDLSPAELERVVGSEIRALLARADRLQRGLGLSRGSVGARLRALKLRPADLYTNDSAGRDRAVADMNAALARFRPHLPTWFNPPLELGSSVRRLTPAEELAGKRGYRDAPADGRPGTYYPDLSSPRDRPRWTLVTVAHHETIPGHMMQLRRQAIAEPHSLQVKYAAGYSEGWAIYAESLVDRIGLLTPIEQLGFIQSVLFRLVRVAADIGIHVHRWERARAVQYLRETVGFELFFPFDVEVDRYCVEPAGFAGDGLAAITLRSIAARRHGPAAMRPFHDAVLNSGPLSVEALAEIASPPVRGRGSRGGQAETAPGGSGPTPNPLA